MIDIVKETKNINGIAPCVKFDNKIDMQYQASI